MVLGYLFALLYGISCIGFAALIYKLGVPKRYTRKIVHVLVGFEWVILYLNFRYLNPIHMLLICLIFTLLLLVDYKRKLLPMMSSDGDNAPGTVYYGVSMSLMSLICCFYSPFIYPFGIAVFCTSFGDGFAGVVGSLVSKCNPKIYKSKTLLGAMANFVFSLATVCVFSELFALNISWEFSICIAALSVGLELVGDRGIDNILLPLGVSLFSLFVITAPDIAFNYIAPIVGTPFVIIIALGEKMLTINGIVAALMLDVVSSLAFGNYGFIILLSFLLLSAVVDRLKKNFLKKADSISEKGDRRDEFQVLANGLVAMFMAAFYMVAHEKMFIVAFAVVLTEAFADTCASGFGTMSKSAYDIFKGKKVAKGISGGMSLLGTFSSLVAAFVFALIPFLFSAINFLDYLLIASFAFLGALFDSFLGSLLQAKYKCDICDTETEKRIHCDTPTRHTAGVLCITNDAVNLFSTLFSAVLIIVFYIIFI